MAFWREDSPDLCIILSIIAEKSRAEKALASFQSQDLSNELPQAISFMGKTPSGTTASMESTSLGFEYERLSN
jgi:hypothetical protein